MPDISPDAKNKAIRALETHGNSILRMSYAYLHSMPDAEDILQDTLFSLMKADPAFLSPDHEKAWLLHVASNLCKNRLKSFWGRRTELSEEFPDDRAQMSSDDSMILDLVKKMPVKYREVIHLFYYEDYPITEIAGLLNKNESTVRSLLRRAKGKLREELKGDYDFDE
jgi:RNA polymerase sigma factor (sigma-70 family)